MANSVAHFFHLAGYSAFTRHNYLFKATKSGGEDAKLRAKMQYLGVIIIKTAKYLK